MLPNILRPLVTDNETTTTLNTKKTRPKKVVRALHHCRFRFALAIVRPKRSACVTSSVKSKSSPKLPTVKRFQLFALNEAIVPLVVDDPMSLHTSCWNNMFLHTAWYIYTRWTLIKTYLYPFLSKCRLIYFNPHSILHFFF